MAKRGQGRPNTDTAPSHGAERNAVERRANDIIADDDPDVRYVDKLSWRTCPILTDEQACDVLYAVANGRSIQNAAREVNSSLLSVMRYRLTNKEFNKAMNEALEIRQTVLEEKAFELAVEGQESTIVKGESVCTRTEYPTAGLLQFLLKGMFPDKYGTERKEIKAGPLETPPEMIRSESDRKKLLARIEQRRGMREEQQAIEAVVLADDFTDLL